MDRISQACACADQSIFGGSRPLALCAGKLCWKDQVGAKGSEMKKFHGED